MVILPLGDESANADDRMKDKLGELLPHLRARLVVGPPINALAAAKPLGSGTVSISQTMTLDSIVQTLEL